MDNELLKQKILANIEQRKTFWTGLIVLSGGMAALLLSSGSFVKTVLLSLGVFAFCFFMIGIKNTNLNLISLFKKMEKKDNVST